MALVDATRAKQDPNLRSLSQSRYFGARPYGVASRSCCATQGSVGDLVTPTWIIRRDLLFDDEECEERSKEEIRHQKARRRPRYLPRDCVERSPIAVLLAGVSERVAGTSGWFACTHEDPVSGVPLESVQPPRVDS